MDQPRTFPLAAENDHLRTQEDILHRQVGFASGYIRKGAQGRRDGGWFHPPPDLMVKPISKRNPERAGGRSHWLYGYGGIVMKRMVIQEEQNIIFSATIRPDE